MGGKYIPSNTIKLTITEHAEAHRLLWLKYGHWQDRLAWQGLSGQIGKEELMHQLFSEAGKKGGPPKGKSSWNKGLTGIYSEDTIQKMSDAKKGKHFSPATQFKKGQVAYNKGQPNPLARDNALRGASKLAIHATGRRMAIREDGTRYWTK